MCYYDPPEGSKKLIKHLCQQIVNEIKMLQKEGDPIGLELYDIKILLDHLYDPSSCQEKESQDESK